MARRSVSVGLTLEAGQYKAEATTVEAKTKGVDRAVTELDRDITKIPPDAAKAAAAMKLLSGNVDTVSERIDSLGKRGDSLKVIDSDIMHITQQMKALAEDFNRTGSADSFSLLQKLTKDRGELVTLRRDISAALGIAAKDAEKAISGAIGTAGQEGSKSLLSSLQGVLSTPVLGPIAVGAIGGAIVAAAPVITATIGSAIIAGGGLGLIAGGIVAQIKSPQVADALDGLKLDAINVFARSTASFAPAVADGVHRAEIELDKLEPALDRIFVRLAPVADRLFAGAVGFVDRLEPGLDALSRAAGPVLGELAAELPGLGQALSTMLRDIASGAPGAVVALHDLFTVIDATAIVAGKLIEYGEKLYGWMRALADPTHISAAELAGLRASSDDAAASLDKLGGMAGEAVIDFQALSQQINQVQITSDSLAGQMTDKLVNGLLASDQATLSWHQSLTGIHDALARNGKSLDENTAKGQANASAILAAVEANVRIYDTNIQAGMSAYDAAKAYDANTQALESQLHKAGLTQQQIDGLIGKYKQVPDDVNTNIAMKGLTDAINGLADLERQIHGIPPNKTVTVTVNEIHRVRGQATPYAGATGGVWDAAGHIRHFADGGMVVAPSDPGTILMGEPRTGGEVLTPLRGISQQRAMDLSRMVGDSYGFDVVPRGRATTTSTTNNYFTINAVQMDENRLAALVDRRIAAASSR